MEWYGIDWSGPISYSDPAQVTVPEVANPLPPYLADVLETVIDPDTITLDNFGKTYVLVRTFVHAFSE